MISNLHSFGTEILNNIRQKWDASSSGDQDWMHLKQIVIPTFIKSFCCVPFTALQMLYLSIIKSSRNPASDALIPDANPLVEGESADFRPNAKLLTYECRQLIAG